LRKFTALAVERGFENTFIALDLFALAAAVIEVFRRIERVTVRVEVDAATAGRPAVGDLRALAHVQLHFSGLTRLQREQGSVRMAVVLVREVRVRVRQRFVAVAV
jgi:hypothetical protein